MLGPPTALRPRSDQLLTPAGLTRHTFEAMGTAVVLVLPAARVVEARRVERLFAEWQGICTRFDPRSQLSRLNSARGEPVVVGELLFRVLSVALEAASATDGLFDPTLLRSLEAIGYDHDFATVVRDAPSRPFSGALPRTGGWRDLRLDAERRTARLPPGVGVDLGGLAKGMAVDAAIVDLTSAGIEVAAVDAGGDLAVVGLPPDADRWSIAIDAPGRALTISLSGGAIATSGVARRRWRQGTEARHHLIDPRTGLPSTADLFSVSVAAPTCAQAEVAAKAAFLLGPEEGSRFLVEHGLAGLFVPGDGTARLAGPRIAGPWGAA
jgi:thiamine biosynthesis lipoprotein